MVDTCQLCHLVSPEVFEENDGSLKTCMLLWLGRQMVRAAGLEAVLGGWGGAHLKERQLWFRQSPPQLVLGASFGCPGL